MVKSALITAVVLVVSFGTAQAADTDRMKQDAWSWIDSQTAVLETANQNIWSYAEIGLAENKSSKELQDLDRKSVV